MTDRTDRETFWDLCRRLGVEPDGRGEVYTPCPNCGKESDRNNVHFSFSEHGAHCFVCGYSATIQGLWQRLYGEDRGDRAYLPPPPKPQRPRYDIHRHTPETLARGYAADERAVLAQWWAYAPKLAPVTVQTRRLGYGILPPHSSRCTHPRLIVPLYCGGQCEGFRARQVACQCGKWLTTGGTQTILYNGARLVSPRERTPETLQALRMGDTVELSDAARELIIVENPVDALLLEQMGRPAVATLGVAMWRDEWTDRVARGGWATVLVLYDNDASGNVTPVNAARIKAAWEADPRHKGIALPARGNRLVNRLLRAGVQARLYPWGPDDPIGRDPGDLLRR